MQKREAALVLQRLLELQVSSQTLKSVLQVRVEEQQQQRGGEQIDHKIVPCLKIPSRIWHWMALENR